MGKFVQLHLLTNYGPANLNRDDLNRPKTVSVGGIQRLRVSSQCLKRAWRTSDVFESSLIGHIGKRTKKMGKRVYKALIVGGIKEKDARTWAILIAGVFGKIKKENKSDPDKALEIEQLTHFSPEEIQAIDTLVQKMINNKSGPSEEDLALLQKKHSAVDIAMFGRMLAGSPAFNTEAAVQVAHAFTVHKAVVEDDYFSAVDDLNEHDEHAGSAHIDGAEFGAGLFYQYICIDRELLKDNLCKDEELVKKAIEALVEATATVSPSGKQNSFASRAYASHILAEKGYEQPRSLAAAFLKPVGGEDVLGNAIEALKNTRTAFNTVYDVKSNFYELNTLTKQGTLNGLKGFCVGV